MEATQASASTGGGSSLGKYRLIAELGHGGMAEVFLAVVRGPAGFNKLVVIKQIRPQLAEDPEFLGMFLDEARLAARLSHPNVVQTNEVGQEGERYFIAMEYLEGQPLNRVLHRLQRTGGLPVPLHLRVIGEVLSGLHHAHELTDYDGTALGVVHRDITPHNIFVTYDGQVKVVDFGIAKALNSSSETRTGVLKGKVAYMAPEQARGERVDRRADIFSVGVLLWEAVTGRRLWKGVPDITILQRLLNGDIPTPKSVKPDVDDKLEAIIMKTLSPQRENRYATALELQTELEGFVEDLDERGSVRDVGKIVTKNFEADRNKIKGIVEEQLRSKAAVPVNSTLPILDQQTHSGGPPEEPTDLRALDSPSKVSKVERFEGTAGGSINTNPSALFTSSAPMADPRPNRRGIIAALAVVGAAAIAGITWFVARPTPPPVVAVPPPTTASVAPAVTDVSVLLAVTPPEAKIYLDDKLLDGNPYRGKLPGDGSKHEVRFEAPGYGSTVRLISLDHNVSLELSLVKDAQPTADKSHDVDKPPPTRVIVVPQTPDDPFATRPGDKGKPRHGVDSTNPYKQP